MNSNIDAMASDQQPTFDHEDDGAGIRAAYLTLPLQHRLHLLQTAHLIARLNAAGTGGMH